MIESDDDVPGLPRADVLIWRERLAARITPDLHDQIAQAERLGFGTLIPADKDWPAGLDDLGERAPYLLWTRGAASFLTTALSDRVTITGSRAATSYGEHVAGELTTGMADEERIVVAGGAYGIEGAAHRAVLAAGGQTIAVLASGIDRPYPAGHSNLLRRIGEVGLLVSEMPPGAAPTRHRFIARSRLMAALSGATVIPEASVRSGSMATALAARELGRGVGAVPGPVTSAASSGTNELIRQGRATLVTQSSDVIALLDADVPGHPVSRSEVGRDFGQRRPSPGTPGRSI
ncbi:DNA-processing protein DprA [Arsenicicoccus bolidensis]|uniref:DNA-processing protein DprA n=1 Tax=Arsenicicoccus bolidensis TaxID=229480 RepID=UPI0028B13428|nr:DNA-processing protein DprA [Arsenicicoccus bolidensis]